MISVAIKIFFKKALKIVKVEIFEKDTWQHFLRRLVVHTSPGFDAAVDGTCAVIGALPLVVPVQFGFAEDSVDQRGIRSCSEGDDCTQRGVRLGLTAVAGDVTVVKQADELGHVPVPAQGGDDVTCAIFLYIFLSSIDFYLLFISYLEIYRNYIHCIIA